MNAPALNTTVRLYLTLLSGGVLFFVLYYVAQARIAQVLKREHPRQWAIIAVPETGAPNAVRTWVRLLQVLRSARPRLPELLGDPVITRWYRVWRVAPWLAWLCWFCALYLQWRGH